MEKEKINAKCLHCGRTCTIEFMVKVKGGLMHQICKNVSGKK